MRNYSQAFFTSVTDLMRMPAKEFLLNYREAVEEQKQREEKEAQRKSNPPRSLARAKGIKKWRR